MNKILRFTLVILCFLGHSHGQSQTIQSKLVDATTQEAIPYASILLASNKGVISNEDGMFTLHLKKKITAKDSLFITYMGYEPKAIPLLHFKDSIIYLNEQAIALNSILISNKHYSAEEIIKKVKENLTKNYPTTLTKKRIFFRQSYHQDLSKMKYTFIKSSIEALNKNLLDSFLQSIPKTEDHYTEILCDLYGDFSLKKQKIHLIKACELYDKNNTPNLEFVEKKLVKILKDNVKPNSYFKIKSGLFGFKIEEGKLFQSTKDTTDTAAIKKELADKKKRETTRKTNFSKYKKNRMAELFEELFFLEGSKLNFIHKYNRYDFKLLDYAYDGETPLYIISFEPKWLADYRGKLYVNADDFALVRVDYSNVKPIKSISLLRISYKTTIDKGKLIFTKGENKKYNLRYLEKETGAIVGIKRPLKIIEKNKHVKGRRKQNELSIKLDLTISNLDKSEIVIFDSQEISSINFNDFKEKNVILPTYLPAYDPQFWKDHTIIAPNDAIKAFTIKENK
ncbi:MAG: hypothetical protein COB98_00280 [Flavobacteriaceae bacterium]|nr:MAG: hypothetical protein COB98_00280 [Flavobacteriaceae bacterium]